jgi:ATP/maltotriose-dependent transcriptional regulator MalT
MLGRDSEWGAIRAALRRASDGRGGVVLVEGDLGMGKSALLAEARSAAVRQGFWVATAAANALERHMPLCPLLAALGEPPDALAALASGTEADDVRLRLIGRVQARLEERVSESPVLVCLDDVDQADPVTMLTLRMLIQHLASYPLVWLLAQSSGGGDEARRLFDLLEGEGAVRLPLRPLADSAVAELIAEVLSAKPDSGLLTLLAGADGNPFALNELVAGLREEGALAISDGIATLVCDRAPRRFQQLTGDRVATLGLQTRQLLKAGAVIGPSFALEDAAEMLGALPSALVPAVEEALAAKIVITRDEVIEFRHALLWHAVVGMVPPPLRRAMHSQFGKILLSRGGSAMPAAIHLFNGARSGDRRLLNGLDRAATEILNSSPPTAADLAVRALELTDAADPGWDERLVTAVKTLIVARRLPQATSLIEQALARPAPAALRAELRCLLSSVFLLCARAEEARTEAEAVLAMSSLPARLRDEARMVLLRALAQLPDKRSAADLSTLVLAAPEQASDEVVLAALAVRAAISWDDGHLAEGLEISRRAAEVATRQKPDVRAFQPYFDLASRLVDIWEFDEIAETLAVAESAGDGHAAGEAALALLRARIYLAEGRMDDAVAEAQAVLGVGAVLGPSPNALLAQSLLALAALRRGELHSAEIHLEEAARYATPDHPARIRERLVIVTAQVAEAQKGPHAALDISAAVYDEIPGHRWMLTADLASVPWLVRTALAADDRARAAAVTAVMDEIAESNGTIPAARSVAAHARGLLARDAGLLRLAAADHADVWLRATAAEDLGVLDARSHRVPEAIEQFGRSLADYEQAGATRDAARIRHRLRGLGVRRRHWTTVERPVEGWDSLTSTERNISELVAEGLTNRQAAERMFISAHTVAFHLRQIFRKLSIGSRVELARLTVEHRRPSAR